MGRRAKTSAEAGIDISPLIDVVFILLIFFMVTATFAKELKLDLERPDARAATVAGPEILRVSVDRSGQLFVGADPVAEWLLESRVRDALAQRGQKEVLVVVDEGVPSARLIQVVDGCRLAGAAEVAVATDREAPL